MKKEQNRWSKEGEWEEGKMERKVKVNNKGKEEGRKMK